MKTLPLFFKKLCGLPQKVEGFLQRRKLSTLIVLLVVSSLLAVCLPLWWFGVFDNLADATYRNEVLDEEKIDRYVVEQITDLPYSERSEVRAEYYKKCYREIAHKMSTEALIEKVSDRLGYDNSFSASQRYESACQEEGTAVFLKELKNRHNVSSTLVRMYLDSPAFYENSFGDVISNLGEGEPLEILLAQPEMRRYLPFWIPVGTVRDQKQEQKFNALSTEMGQKYLATNEYEGASPEERASGFVSRAMKNYLYPDGWKEDLYLEGLGYYEGWNYDKLIEYAKPYIDLEEWGLDQEEFDLQMNRYLDWGMTK